MGTLMNSDDPDEMPHNVTFIRIYTVCNGKNDLQKKEYNIF